MKISTTILNVLFLTTASLSGFGVFSFEAHAAGTVGGIPQLSGSTSVTVCGATEEFDLENIKDAVLAGDKKNGQQPDAKGPPFPDPKNRAECKSNCLQKERDDLEASQTTYKSDWQICENDQLSRLNALEEALQEELMPEECRGLRDYDLRWCLARFCSGEENDLRTVCREYEDSVIDKNICFQGALDAKRERDEQIDEAFNECKKNCNKKFPAYQPSPRQRNELIELLEVVGYSDEEIKDYIDYLTAPQAGCSATKVPTKIVGEFSN